MKNYIIYNQLGKILRTGFCSDKDFLLQVNDDEFVIEGIANDVTQKVINIGIADKIVDKTPAEIEAEKPPEPEPIPFEKQPAIITNKQWQDILNRLSAIEKN